MLRIRSAVAGGHGAAETSDGRGRAMEYSEKFYKKQDAEHIRRMAESIAALETSLTIANTTAANLHDVIRDKDKRIAELEAELGSMKSSHVTGATIHPSLCDEYTKACADNARLRECLKRISDLCITGNTAIEHVISDIAREGEK
jgi:(p)ppGpp synthase/HD superfamily hydrolase